MSAEIHKNDVGTSFRATAKDEDGTVINIASATVKKIIFKKPDGTKVEKNASLVNTGSDGLFEYVTVSGDLNLIGIWRVQGYVKIGTSEWNSDIPSFKVYDNL